ncbi:unknown [Eggerthella sp. CAG:298]|nr:unknown [Eggerthella sp. CAG:298]
MLPLLFFCSSSSCSLRRCDKHKLSLPERVSLSQLGTNLPEDEQLSLSECALLNLPPTLNTSGMHAGKDQALVCA